MADYLATDTELTSIADAIRIKAEISGSLTFPSGFISAINNIPSGGGSSLVNVEYISAIGTEKMIYIGADGVFYDGTMEPFTETGPYGFRGQLPKGSLFIAYFRTSDPGGSVTNLTLRETKAISGRNPSIVRIDFYEVTAP